MDLMLLGYENVFTISLFIIGLAIVLVAQSKVNGAFNKYKRVKTTKGMSGFEVARLILDKNGLENIHVVETKGNLTDHYDPSRKVIRLSKEIFHGDSIASVAVAAHEVGHAIQHKQKYIYMSIRSMLAPVVNIVTHIGYFVMFISLFAGITTYLMFGILIILAALVFQLVTLPVEFDASKRANKELIGLGIISSSESTQTKRMLDAAAMTYVASVVATIINLLRLIIMARGRD
jgi:hypothetical protein